MANNSLNHHNNYNTYFNNSISPSKIRHYSEIAMQWSFDEQAILEDGLVRYSSESNIISYTKIASQLPNKTIRDVAMRCRWLHFKESNKKRREDDNGFKRFRVDYKEINDVAVASNSVPHPFTQTSCFREDGIANELLKKNEELLNQISSNIASLRLTENLNLFKQSHECITNILQNLNENVAEPMKNMLPFPERLNIKLLDSIISISNFQMLP